MVSGGLELRLDSPQPQAEAEVRRRGPGQLYDADDEEGDTVVTSEVVLSRVSGGRGHKAAVRSHIHLTGAMAEVRSGHVPHQDLVLKRKRPNSLNR